MVNKTDLVNYVAQNVEGMNKKLSAEVVDTVLDGITAALNSGDDVNLIGFGKFKIKERKARKGRNPQTGEEIDIAASRAVGFIPGKTLKEHVNK